MCEKLKYNYEVQTTFDPLTKIWSGENIDHYYYDKNCTLGEILYEEMRRNPLRISQIYDPTQLVMTNEQLLLEAIRVASALRERNITQDDIIGIVACNTPHLTAVILACFFNGTPFNSINPQQDTKKMQSLLEITKPKLIFCDSNVYDKIRKGSSGFKTEIVTMTQHNEHVLTVKDFLKPTNEEHKFCPTKLLNGADQTIAILCSSGSTGTPKAVTIANNSKLFRFSRFLTAEDVIYSTSTIDWITGLFVFISNIIYGSVRILSDAPFSPEHFLYIMQKYKVTCALLAPPQISVLVNCPLTTADKLSSLRHILFGGGKCTQQTQMKMLSLLENGKLVFGYGFTESGSFVAINFDLYHKLNSSGRLVPGLKAKIIDDNGIALNPSEIGEICVWTGRKWNGYYGNIEATKELQDADGWYYSGDIGYFDEDGYLFVVERKKYMLKCRSMMYYPNEIEEVIAEMPDVLDVCVLGIWNEKDGDLPGAVVMKRQGSTLTAKDVEHYVTMHIDTEYKQLHAGALILDEMPKNANGKIDRPRLEKMFIEQNALAINSN